MRRLTLWLRLAGAWYALRSIERELHDRSQALRYVAADQVPALCDSLRQTRREWSAARRVYYNRRDQLSRVSEVTA